jgi:hypothetical protein
VPEILSARHTCHRHKTYPEGLPVPLQLSAAVSRLLFIGNSTGIFGIKITKANDIAGLCQKVFVIDHNIQINYFIE